MSAYGTVTRSAPAGRRPPKPSLQIHLFMKKKGVRQQGENLEFDSELLQQWHGLICATSERRTPLCASGRDGVVGRAYIS